MKTRVVVPTNIVYKGATLPEGEYIPIFEDEEGAYFQSPTGVWVWGSSFSGGGLYLPFDPNGQLWFWNDRGGRLGLSFKFWKLPPDVKSQFEIVHRKKGGSVQSDYPHGTEPGLGIRSA